MSPAAECRDLATHCKGLGARQMSSSAAESRPGRSGDLPGTERGVTFVKGVMFSCGAKRSK
ncbi:MAG: hypothetical protein GF307_08310 [candidate division Zixibacteria bacterium]|nr:hypothetical protein [candidate division Zixibacteria bacterium]